MNTVTLNCVCNENTSSCFTCYKEYVDDYRNNNNDTTTCPHSLAFNVGIRLSRKTITLKNQCTFGQYNISPTCYYCNREFNHLDWCSYFWGCILCFKIVFNTKKKMSKLLLCEKCTEERCLFYFKDQNTGMFKLLSAPEALVIKCNSNNNK